MMPHDGSHLQIRSGIASNSDLLRLTSLFYSSTPAKAAFAAPLRALAALAASLEAVIANMRGIDTYLIALVREDEIVGGFLIGHNGTLFRASLQRDFRTQDAIRQLHDAFRDFVNERPRTYHFWTSSDSVAGYASAVGFRPTARTRYLATRKLGPLRFSYFTTANDKRANKPKAHSQMIEMELTCD